MNIHLGSENTTEPNVYGACLYCGSVDGPMVHRYDTDGRPRRLWCVDEAVCTARQNAEAAWAEQRWTITDADRQALALIEQAQQLRLQAAS
jgi:hypothetical protein